MLKLSAETFLLNWNTLLVSGFVAARFSPHLRGWLFLWLALAAGFFFLCVLPHGKADIIFSFLRHHWCWRFRKQDSVIWVPADFDEHLIQNTHKWKHYFCKTKVKSPKLKTYDSYQRFKVSKIAVLDSGFRRTKSLLKPKFVIFRPFTYCSIMGRKQRQRKNHISIFSHRFWYLNIPCFSRFYGSSVFNSARTFPGCKWSAIYTAVN